MRNLTLTRPFLIIAGTIAAAFAISPLPAHASTTGDPVDSKFEHVVDADKDKVVHLITRAGSEDGSGDTSIPRAPRSCEPDCAPPPVTHTYSRLGDTRDCITTGIYVVPDGEPADIFTEFNRFQQAIITSAMNSAGVASFPDCPGGSITITGEIPFEQTAISNIPAPHLKTEPKTFGVVGTRSYVVGSWDTSFTTTDTFDIPGPNPGETISLTGTVRGNMTGYYVDWDWDGHSAINQAAANDSDRSVTGLHSSSSARGYQADSDVNHVYEQVRTYSIGVQPIWTITVDVPGFPTRTLTGHRSSVSATTFEVREAQAVRSS